MIRKFLKFAKSESAKNPYFIRVFQTGNGHFEATPYPVYLQSKIWRTTFLHHIGDFYSHTQFAFDCIPSF